MKERNKITGVSSLMRMNTFLAFGSVFRFQHNETVKGRKIRMLIAPPWSSDSDSVFVQ